MLASQGPQQGESRRGLVHRWNVGTESRQQVSLSKERETVASSGEEQEKPDAAELPAQPRVRDQSDLSDVRFLVRCDEGADGGDWDTGRPQTGTLSLAGTGPTVQVGSDRLGSRSRS